MKLRNKPVIKFSPGIRVILPVLLISLSLPLFAEQETSNQARQLINEMSRASRELNYDGVFVYRRDRRMDTMRLIHKADNNGEQERMVALTGYAREVIRNNKSVTCIFPDNQAVMVEKSRPRKFLAAQLPEPIEKVADFYSFSIGGKDRVAGRSSWIVNIVPKDDFRYGYQIWVDETSKLLLKSELKDNSGWPVEQILFTHLNIVDEIPPQLLKPAISGKGYTWYSVSAEEMPVRSGTHIWTVMDMPDGFTLSDYEKQSVTDSTMPVEHMIYSDGLAMVSVFIEKIVNEPERMQGDSKIGGVNAYATNSNGYQITAVGEVPQKTVQLMANSVVQNK
jgi:sigma-E factor negative regulatory protein RseB